MQVTAIVPSARREGRFEVLVEGRRVATLPADVVARLGLHVGDEVNEALGAAIASAAGMQRTYDRALAMLAARARAARELRLALLRKGEPAPAVDAAVARLTAAGLLDDAAYARQFVRAKMAGPGFSRRRLEAELARRGVARDVTAAALAEVMRDEEADTEAMLDRVARKRLRTLRGDARTRRRRLYGYLARRGYAPDDIRRVSDRLLEDARATGRDVATDTESA